jgi:hypothetical protein
MPRFRHARHSHHSRRTHARKSKNNHDAVYNDAREPIHEPVREPFRERLIENEIEKIEQLEEMENGKDVQATETTDTETETNTDTDSETETGTGTSTTEKGRVKEQETQEEQETQVQVTQVTQPTLSCTICLEPICTPSSAIKLECPCSTSQYHLQCLLRHVKTRGAAAACPTCRTSLFLNEEPDFLEMQRHNVMNALEETYTFLSTPYSQSSGLFVDLTPATPELGLKLWINADSTLFVFVQMRPLPMPLPTPLGTPATTEIIECGRFRVDRFSRNITHVCFWGMYRSLFVDDRLNFRSNVSIVVAIMSFFVRLILHEQQEQQQQQFHVDIPRISSNMILDARVILSTEVSFSIIAMSRLFQMLLQLMFFLSSVTYFLIPAACLLFQVSPALFGSGFFFGGVFLALLGRLLFKLAKIIN